MSTQILYQGSHRPTRFPAIRSRYKISSAFLDNLLRPLMSVHHRRDQVALLQRRSVVHPGLQVHSITAPETDRRLSFLMSANLYCALAASAVLVAQASPTIHKSLISPDRPTVIVDIRPPEVTPRPVAAIAPIIPNNLQSNSAATPPNTEPQPIVDTDNTPTSIGTRDLSNQIAANLISTNSHNPGTGTSPGVGIPSPATGQPMEVNCSAVSVLHQIQPIYPSLARMAHKEGDVVLIMTIDDQGVPTDVKMDSGDTVFRNDAIRAAQQWRFTPARFDGQPHAARFRLTIQFRLRG